MIAKLRQWLGKLNVRDVLIVLFILASTAHVGRLFAAREHEQQAVIGYVLAIAIDGVLALSLYEATRASKRQHRVFALIVFLLTCAVSAGFNVAYYRTYHPSDALWVSGLLGSTAPVLAALVAVLRAFGDVEQRQDAHALEIELAQLREDQRRRERWVSRRNVPSKRGCASSKHNWLATWTPVQTDASDMTTT